MDHVASTSVHNNVGATVVTTYGDSESGAAKLLPSPRAHR